MRSQGIRLQSLVALCSCAAVLLFQGAKSYAATHVPNQIIHITVCGPTEILGVSKIAEGDWRIWSYDWSSTTFMELTRTEGLTRPIPGSTPHSLIWGIIKRKLARVDYFCWEPGMQSPVFLRGSILNESEEKLYVPIGFIPETKRLLVTVTLNETGGDGTAIKSEYQVLDLTSPWNSFDDAKSTGISTILSFNWIHVGTLPSLSRKLLIVIEADINQSVLRLFETDPFRELDFIFFDRTAIYLDSSHLQDIITITMTESNAGRFIEKVRVIKDQDSYALKIISETPMPPESQSDDIFPIISVNGYILWYDYNTEQTIVTQKSEEGNSSLVKIPTTPEHMWKFSTTHAAKQVIVRKGIDSFAIYQNDFPDLKLLETCRVSYSQEQDGLVLNKLNVPRI